MIDLSKDNEDAATIDSRKKRELAWLVRVAKHLQDSNFYGRSEVIWEKGEIQRIIESKSLLPPTRGH